MAVKSKKDTMIEYIAESFLKSSGLNAAEKKQAKQLFVKVLRKKTRK